VLEINRPKFGPTFKKNAPFVQGYFDSLLISNELGAKAKDTDKLWDENKLKKLEQNMKAAGGYV